MTTSGGAAHLAPLAIAVPIVVACLVYVVGRHLPRALVDAVATLTALGVVGIDAALLVATHHDGRVVTWAGGWQFRHGFSVGIALVADPIGAGLALIVAALVAVALLYSWRYFEDAEAHFHALVLLFCAGMQGFALTGDLFDMFVFFELMGAVAYALTGYKIEDASALQGALNFGIINSLGAYLALCGVGLLYGRTGQLGLAQLGHALDGHPVDALVVAAYVLVVTGWLVKAAMVPLHFWLADAHAVAPTPICVLFSGVMVELGVYGVARVSWVVFGGSLPHHVMEQTYLTMGAITAVVATVMCVQQRHLKRLLAYSTIAHVGLFLTAFATFDEDGTAGAALYVAGHAGAKSALFLLAGTLLNRYGSVDEIELHGRGRGTRVMPWLYLLATAALAGLPPFGTGLGKGVAEDALVAAGVPWGPALFVLVSGVTAGAVLRAGLRIYWGVGEPPEELAQPEASTGEEEQEVPGGLSSVPVSMLSAIVITIAGTLALGLIPGVAKAVGRAADRFIDRAGYIGQTLHGAHAGAVHASDSLGWTVSGVGLGVASVVLAVAVALVAIHHRRLPVALRRAAGTLGPAMRVVRSVHSGHVGDYVAWMMVGIAALGALIGFPLR